MSTEIPTKTVFNRKRGNLQAQITRIKNTIDENLDSNHLSLKLQNLEKLKSKLDDLRNESYGTLSDRDLHDFEEGLNKLADEMDLCEVRLLGLLNSHLSSSAIDNSVVSGRSSGPGMGDNCNIKLPSINLPQFSGHYSEWVVFRSQFESLIGNSEQLSDSQKLIYLKSCLTGTAKQLQSVNDTYQSLFQALTLRFENKRLIVNSHINKLLNLPKIKSESPKELRNLVDTVLANVRALNQLDLECNPLSESILINVILKSVDDETNKQYQMSLNSSEIPQWNSFLEFLNKRSQSLLNIESNPFFKTRSPSRNIHQQKSFVVKRESDSCSMCSKNHPIYKCDVFSQLSVRDRQVQVKRLNLCVNCLGTNHTKSQCKKLFMSCKKCSYNHHTLLHFDKRNPQIVSTDQAGFLSNPPDDGSASHKDESFHMPQTNEVPNQNKTFAAIEQGESSRFSSGKVDTVLLSTAIVHVRDKTGKFIPTLCLLDSASQCTLITNELSDVLGLKYKKVDSSISGVGDNVLKSKGMIEAEIANRDLSFQTTVNALVVRKISSDLIPAKPLDISIIKFPQNLVYANPQFHRPSRIQMLLGAEVFFKLLGSEQIKLNNDSIILQNTAFGFIVTGSLDNTAPNTFKCNFVRQDSDTRDIEVGLQKFWELEAIGIEDTSEDTFENDAAMDIFQKTVSFRDGRYEVRLPFKRPPEDLPNNFSVAERRLRSLLKRFQRNPSLLKDYQEILNEYVNLGIIERVTESEPTAQPLYYMPHQAVIREESVTTKTRIVFDASSHEDGQLSLNDCLWPGVNLNPNIFNLLVSFRLKKVALVADIEKAFLQISLHPDDRDAVRFLFIDNQYPYKDSMNIQIFRFNRVSFGVTSSPFLLSATIKEHISKYKEKYPKVFEVLNTCFYVDDLICGGDSASETFAFSQLAVQIMRDASMTLRKFISNDKTLMDMMEKHGLPTLDTGVPLHKILGLSWNIKKDTLSVDLKRLLTLTRSDHQTKRSILQASGTVFDPLGFLSPFTVRLKCLFQELWSRKLSWDDELPLDIRTAWMKWSGEVTSLSTLDVPRTVLNSNPESVNELQIHVFSDASQKAFGAAAYLRVKDCEKTSVNLIASKSRVAPLKKLTLPRLELMGALLAVKLAKTVEKTVQQTGLYPTVHFWTDSQITLCWIKGQPHRWKQFVSNRVKEIHSLSDPSSWSHVPGTLNVADHLTRGLSIENLLKCEAWWHGPTFLGEDNFPVFKCDNSIPEEQYRLELKKDKSVEFDKCFTLTENENLFENDLLKITNNFSRLVRILSYVLRFVHNCKNIEKRGEYLTSGELCNAELFLVKYAQSEYREEINSLSNGKNVKSKSKLSSLNCFLDRNAILRVGGRIANSSVSNSAKHPIVISPKHKVTYMIVEFYHLKYLHAGPQLLLYLIRQKFWIINGRNLCRKICFSCVKCFKTKPIAMDQIMGDLPSDRVNRNFPFNVCGIDYCGPFYIKYKNQRKGLLNKVYVCIFVCFVTKAVHLEIVDDMTSESFISTLKRFFARRGKSARIYSDNAQTFVGANREIKRLAESANTPDDKLNQFLVSEEITWKFLPPRAPNFGGLWEAGVKSFKYHMKRVVGNMKLTYEEFLTITVQIECMLNSRPLVPLSTDDVEVEVLTPAHFLIGREMNAILEPDLTNLNENRLNCWQRVTKSVQLIWKKWSQDYLSSLQERNKWKFIKNDVKEGHVVVIKEDNLPPSKWMLGVISKVVLGKDQRVRVVEVKTSCGILKRSVNRLCLLPFNK